MFIALGLSGLPRAVNIWDEEFLQKIGMSLDWAEAHAESIKDHIDAVGYGLLVLGALVHFSFFAGKRNWGQIGFTAEVLSVLALGCTSLISDTR